MWEFFWGKSEEKVERETRQKVNESVATTQEKVAEMTVRRNFLEKRCRQLEPDIRNEQLNKETREIKYQEYLRYQGEMDQIDGALDNIRTIESATSKASIGATAFQTQKDAHLALAAMNRRMDIDKIEDLHDELEFDIERSEELTRVVSKPLKHTPYTRSGKKAPSLDETIANWNSANSVRAGQSNNNIDIGANSVRATETNNVVESGANVVRVNNKTVDIGKVSDNLGQKRANPVNLK